MFKQLFFFFFASINHFAVDPEGGAVEQEEQDDPVNVEDAVLEDVFDEDGNFVDVDEEAEEEQEGTTDDQKKEGESEEGEEEKEAEDKKKDKKSEEESEDDLKPLETDNQKTKERFDKLREISKGKDETIDELKSDNQRMRQSIDALNDLGYNDEQAAADLVEFSAYRKALYSGDVTGMQNMLAEQVRRFEERHGKKLVVTGSVLDNYQDLREKVDAMDLDEDDAIALAKTRAMEKRLDRENQEQQASQQQAQARQQQIDEAVNAVTAFEAHLSKSDPDYAAIKPHLQKQVQIIAKSVKPEFWVESLQNAYATLKDAMATKEESTNNPAPLRGNSNGGGERVPQSTEEAVLQAMNLQG